MGVKKPYICTEIEAKAVDFAFENLSAGEPCSIIGMSGNVSKNLLTDAVYQKLNAGKTQKTLLVFTPNSKAELETNLRQIENTKVPLTVILCLSLAEDCSQYLEQLELFRNQHKTEFCSLIIAHVGAVYKALETRQKILVRSMFVMKPLAYTDLVSFLKSFEDRLGFKLNLPQKKAIFSLSGGNMGLIKSMYLAVKNHPDFKLSVTNLFSDESVLFRLQTIASDLPMEKIAALFSASQKPLDKLFFTKFGYVSGEKVFTPLLKSFVEMSDLLPDTKFQYSLTNRELMVFKELKKAQDNFVSRDAMAYILWGEKWEELYSDWALDQLTHRLKTKLAQNSSPFILVTKKGFGLMLTHR